MFLNMLKAVIIALPVLAASVAAASVSVADLETAATQGSFP